MFDMYGRKIDYLRLSVTNRCNLCCKYCMPDEGAKDEGQAILTLAEISRFVRIAARAGIRSVRLTGGEPLVRKDITALLAGIAGILEIDDIAMTTNGVLFADRARELKQAGLQRVNFSLDTLNAERFRYITGRDLLQEVLRAISTALEIGLAPVKINAVVMKGINDREILNLAELARVMPLHVRFIECMPIGDLPFYKADRFVPAHAIRAIIEEKYELSPDVVLPGRGPAAVYQIRNGLGTVGFISAMSDHFCGECSRMRLTADGKLRGCLFGKNEINAGLALKNQAGDDTIAELFMKAVKDKPERHCMNTGWGADNTRRMYQIGG